MQPSDRFEGLVAIMNRLRDPGGCPWDREQDFQSLRTYLIEECFEVAEALDRADPAGLREELGDLLFQIVFLAKIAEERGSFSIRDVVHGISDKLIRRHPHVFGTAEAGSAAEVARNWERIKREERSGARRLLDSIPRSLPALLGAQRLGDKAAQVGFDWPAPAAVLDKIEEEVRELRAALASGERGLTSDELGDVLFSLAMLARHAGLDAEAALAGSNRRFRARFGHVESELERRGLETADLDLLERLWQEAKRRPD
jgi:MazG family protein